MVRIGKVYQNLMIDVRPTNKKLRDRAVSIVTKIVKVSKDSAKDLLEANDYKIKHVILMLKYKINIEKANEILKENNGILRKAFQQLG
jgi:N-acetylmuramic acid 6-phosphate etherase